MAEEKDEKTNLPTIQQSTTSFTPTPPTHNVKTKGSSSASTLLSADYNRSHNPKKDELVQTASIRILEVESLLDKLNSHIDKHHRKSSQQLQNFEQIHTELSKIQSTLILDNKNDPKNSHKPSQIDPFIIIASNDTKSDDSDEKDDEKYDNNNDIETIHNSLAALEPFQSLVSKMQQNVDPNHKITFEKRSSIKVKASELDSIHVYVNQHRHKMQQKTFQYEEKKKQLFSAKQRLNAAKTRFKKRLKKSKQKSSRRLRAHSANKRNKKYNKKHKKKAVSDITTPGLNKFGVINENSDVDMDMDVLEVGKLSHANLNKLNRGHSHPHKHGQGQVSAPIFLSGAYSPQGHGRGATNSSVSSAFSVISDQSFVDDFHSITAELENIDDIVRNQVKSGSMTSIFSDLGTPKVSPRQSPRQTRDGSDCYVKNNISCLSGESESNNAKNIQSYCSSIADSSIEVHESLQSDIFHLQDIEHQIGDL